MDSLNYTNQKMKESGEEINNLSKEAMYYRGSEIIGPYPAGLDQFQSINRFCQFKKSSEAGDIGCWRRS